MSYKKIIEGETLQFAIKNTEKYLESAGFSTSGVDLNRCVEEHGYCERLNKSSGEAWVSYINKNKFQVEVSK